MNDMIAKTDIKTSTIAKTSAHGMAGRHPTRQFLDSLSGNKDPGSFGRMFPTLKPLDASDAALKELADAMRDAAPNDPAGDNANIPAGFTYLGQFVDHDITLDTTSLAEQKEDPLGTKNFRTPRLDLDAVYGSGPGVNPHIFKRGAGPGFALTANLLIGKTQTGGADSTIPANLPNDLPRSPEGQALISDPRNDENLLVAQTHLAFLKFHNKVVKTLESGPTPPTSSALFDEARKVVVWHYQWLVLHDLVERITEKGIVARILHEGRKFYRFKTIPYMPVEFSAAAYRLGHSMVREVYSHNRVFRPGGVAPATLDLLFKFSGKSGLIIGDLAPNPPTGPLPVRVLPSDWIIDWRRFYDFRTPAQPLFEFNPSRRLDPLIVPALHTLPGETGNGASLPFRNLRRGVILGLPSGQDVAKAMKIPALTPAELSTGPDGVVAKKHGFDKATPLWYYILKEAAVKSGGERLGPVGARLVAEVFVGLVAGDKDSYLSQKNWKPTLPAKVTGTFTMTDLLQFVGDIDPIDGITTVNTL